MSLLFQCGLTPAADGTPSPFSVVHLAGLEFPKITQKITGYGPEQVNSDIQGVVHELTEEKHKAVLESLKKKIVRQSSGKKAKASLFVTDGRQFRPNPDTDRPLADFIYIRPADHDPQEGRRFDTVSSLQGDLKVHEQESVKAARRAEAQLADQAKEIATLRSELEEATAPKVTDPAESDQKKPEGKKGKPSSK